MRTIVKQETEETQETQEKMITIETHETPLEESKETRLQPPAATVFISKPQVSFSRKKNSARLLLINVTNICSIKFRSLLWR